MTAPFPSPNLALASGRDLYEDDFYLWTKAQAAALRDRAQGANAIDYDRVAEEVEDLGRSEWREARSLVIQIIKHLYKLAWSSADGSRRHWMSEIITSRADAEAALTPSIRRKIEGEFERLHAIAAKAAELDIADDDGEPGQRLARVWSLDALLVEPIERLIAPPEAQALVHPRSAAR